MCHAQSERVVNVPPLLISVSSWQGMQGGDLKLLGGLKCVLMGVVGVQASELIPLVPTWQAVKHFRRVSGRQVAIHTQRTLNISRRFPSRFVSDTLHLSLYAANYFLSGHFPIKILYHLFSSMHTTLFACLITE
jgi:hypothetical protein